jgi:hypothetical protein
LPTANLCKGNGKPNSSRLTVTDQQAEVNTNDQELYHRMVGSIISLASWTWPLWPDISFTVCHESWQTVTHDSRQLTEAHTADHSQLHKVHIKLNAADNSL